LQFAQKPSFELNYSIAKSLGLSLFLVLGLELALELLLRLAHPPIELIRNLETLAVLPGFIIACLLITCFIHTHNANSYQNEIDLINRNLNAILTEEVNDDDQIAVSLHDSRATLFESQDRYIALENEEPNLDSLRPDSRV
jgi:hypothetical protein